MQDFYIEVQCRVLLLYITKTYCIFEVYQYGDQIVSTSRAYVFIIIISFSLSIPTRETDAVNAYTIQSKQ